MFRLKCTHRVHTNRENVELFETLDSLKLVRSKYMEAFEKLGSVENIFSVDGNRSPDLIAHDIWQKVGSMLEQNK